MIFMGTESLEFTPSPPPPGRSARLFRRYPKPNGGLPFRLRMRTGLLPSQERNIVQCNVLSWGREHRQYGQLVWWVIACVRLLCDIL